jgi:hypothetical protein
LLKSDINRKMQENLKNVYTQIAEDIRKDWIKWISTNKWAVYDMVIWSNRYKKWTWLYTNSENKYYLALLDPASWEYIRVDSSECIDLKSNCVIYKLSNSLVESWPLTNSFVSIKDFKLYLSVEKVPKITMTIITQPSIRKWVKSNLIKNSKIIFETTISERPF